MIKLLVWLSGSCGLLWLAWRFATWHLLVQLAVLGALFLWVVGGGLLLAYRVKRSAVGARQSAADRAAVRPGLARNKFVEMYGEDAALAVEKNNYEVWAHIDRASGAAK